MARASRFCVFWIRKTMRKVTNRGGGIHDELPGVGVMEVGAGESPRRE